MVNKCGRSCNGKFSIDMLERVFSFISGLECSTGLALSVCRAFDAGRPYYKQARCYGEGGSSCPAVGNLSHLLGQRFKTQQRDSISFSLG